MNIKIKIIMVNGDKHIYNYHTINRNTMSKIFEEIMKDFLTRKFLLINSELAIFTSQIVSIELAGDV